MPCEHMYSGGGIEIGRLIPHTPSKTKQHTATNAAQTGKKGALGMRVAGHVTIGQSGGQAARRTDV